MCPYFRLIIMIGKIVYVFFLLWPTNEPRCYFLELLIQTKVQFLSDQIITAPVFAKLTIFTQHYNFFVREMDPRPMNFQDCVNYSLQLCTNVKTELNAKLSGIFLHLDRIDRHLALTTGQQQALQEDIRSIKTQVTANSRQIALIKAGPMESLVKTMQQYHAQSIKRAIQTEGKLQTLNRKSNYLFQEFYDFEIAILQIIKNNSQTFKTIVDNTDRENVELRKETQDIQTSFLDLERDFRTQIQCHVRLSQDVKRLTRSLMKQSQCLQKLIEDNDKLVKEDIQILQEKIKAQQLQIDEIKRQLQQESIQ